MKWLVLPYLVVKIPEQLITKAKLHHELHLNLHVLLGRIGVENSPPKVHCCTNCGTVLYIREIFEIPPPSTRTSGSKQFTAVAIARASLFS